MDLIVKNANSLAEGVGKVWNDFAGNPVEEFTVDDLYDTDEADPRLFFLALNTSATLTTGQALALILGISALIGGLAAALYYFLLSYSGQSGYGYSSGYGGHSGSGGGYDSGYDSHGYSKRSIEDSREFLNILAVVAKLEEELGAQSHMARSTEREECRRLKICQRLSKEMDNEHLLDLLNQSRSMFHKRWSYSREISDNPVWSRIHSIILAHNTAIGRDEEKCNQTFKCL